MEKYDCLVLGGGPAGVTAAIYAKRYNLKVRLIALTIGGLLTEASKVDNWTGFFNITGAEITEKLMNHLNYLNVEFCNENIEKIYKEKNCFFVKTDSNEYQAKTLIYALGTVHRKLDVKGSKEFEGKGISYCATCDGPFFKNKIVGIIGGGNSAGRAAQLLLEYAKKIILIHRGDKKSLRMEPALQDELFAHKNFEFIEKANVVEFFGDKFLQGVKLDIGKEIRLDGIFVEIGLLPKTELVKNIVKLDEENYIIVDDKMKTNIEGFFAAGDVVNKNKAMRQAITAAAQGAIAAMSAFHLLRNKEFCK